MSIQLAILAILAATLSLTGFAAINADEPKITNSGSFTNDGAPTTERQNSRKISEVQVQPLIATKSDSAGVPANEHIHKLGKPLLDALASSSASDQALDIHVRLAEPVESYSLEPEEKRNQIATLQGPVIALIESHGGNVTYRCENLWCLHARGTLRLVALLAALENVARIDLEQIETSDAETSN